MRRMYLAALPLATLVAAIATAAVMAQSQEAQEATPVTLSLRTFRYEVTLTDGTCSPAADPG